MKALALGQLSTLFRCYPSRCSTYTKPPSAGMQNVHVTESRDEYKIGPFQITPRDSLMEFLLPILTWFFQIRCPDSWDWVGRDTSTKRCLRIPAYESHLLSLCSSYCGTTGKEKSVDGDNRPRLPWEAGFCCTMGTGESRDSLWQIHAQW